MRTLFKGLTRPALIRGLGVPLYPFLGMCIICVLLGVWIHEAMYALILPGWYAIRRVTQFDERFFDLLYLRTLVKGHPLSNKRFSAVHYAGSQYDEVDISKVDNFMKLKDQSSVEELIPYSSHITDNIIVTKNRDLLATWQIDGAYFECVDSEDLSILTDQLNTLIRSFEGKSVTLYPHRIRCKKDVRPVFNSKIPFVNRVMNDYYESFPQSEFFENKLFLTICFKPFTTEDKVTHFFSRSKKQKDIFKEPVNEMNEICDRLNTYLSRFHSRRLGLYEDHGVVYSDQLSLFQYLLSGRWQKVRVSSSPFYTYLGGKDLFFGNDAGQITASDHARYFRCIEIKDYFQETDAGILDALMYLPVEYVVTSSFTAMDKQSAIKALDDQIDKLEMTDDAAKSLLADLKVGLDMVSSGYISFGKSHQTLVVFADSPERLVKDTNIVTSTLEDLGLIVTYSTLSLGAAYFAQLPGNYTLRPRLSTLSSLNFAEMESFHNFFSGKEKGNTWGEKLITLRGSGNDIYHLNYHMTTEHQNFFGKNPTLGHTEILGTSNVGKTVLLMTKAFAAQQFGTPESFPANRKLKKLTTVFFDKDRAGEVGIRAMGGSYYRVKEGEPTGWNPAALPPTKRNIAFMKDLVRLLCTLNSEPLDDYQNSLISDAVERLMQRSDRSYPISKLRPLIQEPDDTETKRHGLKARLKPWTQGEEFGWVFDNREDTFDVDNLDVFGIDGTEFLDNKVLASAASFYLIYRVTMLADGRRLLIYMDEFWQWINNEAFRDFVYNKLKTGRKLDMVLVVATQSPDELIKSPIAAAVREQCATHIYLANPKAKRSEYVDGLQVRELYFDKIKAIDPLSRQFLVVKNPQRKGESDDFAAFARLELGKAAYYLPVLSASKPQLELFDEIWKEGMKPEEWLDTYLEQANLI
ncbi:VirB3 family type IV secretion system protein [Escherichia coli]|uniref:VirB4 family type IV secretion/conjugal transfer ATPase n=1 Tax=Escherichia coli TaxID=562 RepID=UPI00050A959E|nr:VirB3 family type IV secretion system protein [Escherichia coli]